MSVELLVWKARTKKPTARSESGDRAAEYEPSEEMLRFHDELLQRYPPLESFGVEDRRIRESPWAATPTRSDRLIELSVRERTADHVLDSMIGLAREHALVVHDSREQTVVTAYGVEKIEPEIHHALIGAAFGLLMIYLGRRIPLRVFAWPIIALGWLFVVVMTLYVLVVFWKALSSRMKRRSAKARGHIRRDPQLGTLTRNVKGRYWTSTLTVRDWRVDVVIAGDEDPVPQLLARARELVTEMDTLERRVDDYVARELKDDPSLDAEIATEIRTLRVSGLNLRSPDRPNHVVIDLEGLDEMRYWRCEYVDGEVSELDYDS